MMVEMIQDSTVEMIAKVFHDCRDDCRGCTMYMMAGWFMILMIVHDDRDDL